MTVHIHLGYSIYKRCIFCFLGTQVWFYEQTRFEKMRTSTGTVPRYLDWFEGLSSKVKRPVFQNKLISLHRSDVRKEPVEPFKCQKPFLKKGFIAVDYLDYVCNIQKLQGIFNTKLYDMLFNFTPILMKFGVVPCQFLRDQFEELNPKVVYLVWSFPKLEDIDPVEMDRILRDVDQAELQYSARKEAAEKKMLDKCKCYMICYIFLQFCNASFM